jgi:hypothetical protein
LEARGWNLCLWSQADKEDFGAQDIQNGLYFPKDTKKQYCMMGVGGEFRSRMWSVTSAAGEACK